MDRNHDQLLKIARLYYIEDTTQKEIARKLNISIATVSRNLARAKDLGLVEIRVRDDNQRYRDLEIALEKSRGLKECIVVPTEGGPGSVPAAFSASAGELLSRILSPGDLLGVSWGETLKGLGEAMASLPRLRIDVVPIIGAMGEIETGVYPNAIAQTYAAKLGGRAYLVNTPALVDTPAARQTVERDSSFAPIRNLWNRIQTVMLSVSSVDGNSSVYRMSIFSPRQLASLRRLGVVCATNFNFLDARGAVVPNPISDMLINLGYNELRKKPNVILVAFGEAKVRAINAALRGGVGDILLTDEKTARLCLRG